MFIWAQVFSYIYVSFASCGASYVCIYVTEFAKRGLIHASDFSTLRICNSASVGPIALKFGGRTFPSLY